MRTLIWVAALLSLCEGTYQTAGGFEHFVTRRGDKLMEGQNEYRFISFNIPNLHYVEDNLPFEEMNPWRLPNEFEITDALLAVRQMGGRVARTYTLSVRKADDDPAIPRHVLGPGRFNEQAFRALDKVLEVANKTGVRVIIPFVDNWVWWGGIQEYAGFRNKSKEEFWTDPQVIADFKQTIAYVLNRTNTCTGVKYKNDKAVLAWETGNELQCPPRWTHQIAAYIKQLDGNHLVVDGFFTSVLRGDSLDDPLVDIVTTHHYPRDPQVMIEQVATNRARSKGRKPYFVGEFGFVETDAVRKLLDVVIDEGVAGALIWSLRFRNRDGGFYWHSEPFGGDKYKAYHWPGFASGDAYDERNLLALMRRKAHQIQGLAVPELVVPQPPRLLPIDDVAAISWQGSAGAASYIVERATSANGPWKVVARDVSDAAVPYRPLFNDTEAEIGRQYFYRVKARNGAGASAASNTVGPVTVRHLTLVDEMTDLSLMEECDGVVRKTDETRKAKEDMDRVTGGDKGASIVYRTPQPVRACKIYAFFSKRVNGPVVSLSSDGRDFTPAFPLRRNFSSGEGAYGYFKPSLYEIKARSGDIRFVKFLFGGGTQISRVEIAYGGAE